MLDALIELGYHFPNEELEALDEAVVLLGGKTEGFLRTVKVGKTALKDEIRTVSGLKGKALDLELGNMLQGCTELKQSEPTIEKL